MSWLVYIIVLAFWSLVVGAFARLALPGKDPMTIPQTMLVGLGGIVGATLWYAITNGRYFGGGFLISLAFAAVIVYFIRRSRGGGLTDPGNTQLRR